MPDNNKSPETQDKEILIAKERRKVVEMVGVVAIFGMVVLWLDPTWPGAIGVVGILIAIAYISSKMLKKD